MKLRAFHPSDAAEAVQLVTAAFRASGGEAEGDAVGALVRNLIDTTPAHDLRGFVAEESGVLLGSIFFSRLTFEREAEAFILSPVAVDADHQGRGIGQALIRYGLEALRGQGVEVVVTYGDPAYYAKVGFLPLPTRLIAPPHPLSQPEGWIGQSLAGANLPALGRASCVEALDDARYW
jgi:predicted N-acetyltransferase YhbS